MQLFKRVEILEIRYGAHKSEQIHVHATDDDCWHDEDFAS